MISIVCGCKSCINNDPVMRTCKLKVLFIDADGTCGDREEKEPEGNTDESDSDVDITPEN
jgi:hypothetical protein